MKVEVATRPAAVSRFRRGELGGSRTDRGVVPEHVVVILRLSSMAVFAETVETTSEPVVKYVDAGGYPSLSNGVDRKRPLSNVQKLQYQYTVYQSLDKWTWGRDQGYVYQGTGVLQSLHSLAWISLHPKITLLARAAYNTAYILRSSSPCRPRTGDHAQSSTA